MASGCTPLRGRSLALSRFARSPERARSTKEVPVDVLVTGLHCQITDDFRTHVGERLSGVEKLRDRVIRVEVQVSANPHARQPDQATNVEITLRSRAGGAGRGQRRRQTGRLRARSTG